MGGFLALPILGLAILSFARPNLRSFRGSAGLLLLLYVVQVLLIAAGEGNGIIQALHPANAMAIAALSVLIARSAVLPD